MSTSIIPGGRHPPSKKSLVWRILPAFVWALSSYPFVFSLAAIFFKLDPPYHILAILNITHPLPHIFRFYIVCTIPAELCRLLAFIALFSISTPILLRDTLILLIRENSTPVAAIVGRISCTRAISQYRQVQIVMLSMEEFLGYSCFFVQALALLNSILYNFVSLKFYATLPIWFYAIFPSMAVMTLVIIHVLMPGLHVVLDNSKKLL